MSFIAAIHTSPRIASFANLPWVSFYCNTLAYFHTARIIVQNKFMLSRIFSQVIILFSKSTLEYHCECSSFYTYGNMLSGKKVSSLGRGVLLQVCTEDKPTTYSIEPSNMCVDVRVGVRLQRYSQRFAFCIARERT